MITARQRALVVAAQMLTVAALLYGWHVVGASSSTGFSNPADVGEQLLQWVRGDHGRWHDLSLTLQEASIGLLLAVLGGTALALAVTTTNWLLRFVTPFIVVVNAIPKLALAPLFILIFGIGMNAKVYYVTAGLAVLPFFALVNSVRDADPMLAVNVRVLGGGRRQVVRHVNLPAMGAALVATLRLSVTWALLVATVGETFVSQAGVGHVVRTGQQQLRNDVVLGGIIVVAVLAFVSDRILLRIERRLLRWRSA